MQRLTVGWQERVGSQSDWRKKDGYSQINVELETNENQNTSWDEADQLVKN